jgi:hypothetical protein
MTQTDQGGRHRSSPVRRNAQGPVYLRGDDQRMSGGPATIQSRVGRLGRTSCSGPARENADESYPQPFRLVRRPRCLRQGSLGDHAETS